MPACMESRQCNAGRNNAGEPAAVAGNEVPFLISNTVSMARVTVTYSLRANNFNTAERTTAVESHDNGLVLFVD